MANIFGIEVSGDTYNIEDSQARQDTQTNAQDIDGIEGKIPSSASTSNKLATQNDLPDLTVSEQTVSVGLLSIHFRKTGKVVTACAMNTISQNLPAQSAFENAIPEGFAPKQTTVTNLVLTTIDDPGLGTIYFANNRRISIYTAPEKSALANQSVGFSASWIVD